MGYSRKCGPIEAQALREIDQQSILYKKSHAMIDIFGDGRLSHAVDMKQLKKLVKASYSMDLLRARQRI